jgi:uncharacterized protein
MMPILRAGQAVVRDGEEAVGVASADTVVTWQIEISGGFETAWVRFGEGRLDARGRAVGLDPEPYWLTYTLATGDGWVTRRLVVELESAAGATRLDLARHDDGTWTANGDQVDGVGGALDCDLGRSPLTNTMPLLRHRLDRSPGDHELVMAWVSVPDLTVHRSEQRYTHLRPAGPRGEPAVVGYVGRHRGFEGELAVGPDGLLDHYPGLGRRVASMPARPQGASG